MSHRLHRLIRGMLCVLCVFVVNNLSAANQVVARVNGEILTEREVNLYAKMTETNPKDAIQIAITDKLILQAALKDKVKVTADEVETTIKGRIEKIGMEKFTKIVLEPVGMTMDDYRQLVRDQLTRDHYIHGKIGAPSTTNKNDKSFIINNFVSPREIKEYFESHKQEFVTPPKIKTRQIILKFTDAVSKNDKKTRAETIQQELKNGADFEALAKKYSEVKADSGGLWDWTEKGSFPKEIEDVIYKLKAGQVSDIIKTATSFLIIKVEEKVDETFATVDTPEIQARIKKILASKKIADGIEEFRKELVKEADIQVLK